jgi:hypothetical protein
MPWPLRTWLELKVDWCRSVGKLKRLRPIRHSKVIMSPWRFTHRFQKKEFLPTPGRALIVHMFSEVLLFAELIAGPASKRAFLIGDPFCPSSEKF